MGLLEIAVIILGCMVVKTTWTTMFMWLLAYWLLKASIQISKLTRMESENQKAIWRHSSIMHRNNIR
jgi:uncharacterized membrane protein